MSASSIKLSPSLIQHLKNLSKHSDSDAAEMQNRFYDYESDFKDRKNIPISDWDLTQVVGLSKRMVLCA